MGKASIVWTYSIDFQAFALAVFRQLSGLSWLNSGPKRWPKACLHCHILAEMVTTWDKTTKYLHIYSTEQCLASFELLTPHPSPPSECVPPRTKGGGGTHSPGGEGVGGQYFGRRQTLDWPLTV